MYLYETSGNIQELWPPDFYFTVHWLDFGQIIKVKVFVQGRISRPINCSKLIFHMRMYLYETSRNIQEPWPPDLYFTVHWLDFGQIFKVKVFVQGRISRPANGSKLIFHMRIYLYETSRNIQEPWPPDLYFMVHWLWTLARLSRLRFLSKVVSQDLLMVASWYFIWGSISMRPAGIYKSHDLLIYISWSADFRIWLIFHG